MKNILFPSTFIFFLIISTTSFAQLNPGDIMIIGFMGDGDGTPIPTPTDPPSANCGDGFSFVCMVDIPAGEQVIFSEEEWTTSGFNNGDEGHVIWTNNTGSTIRAGNVVQVTTHGQQEVTSGNCGTLISTAGTAIFGDDGVHNSLIADNWALSSSNEEIYVYQGTPGNPTNWISAFFTDDFGVNSFVPASLIGFVVNLESIDPDADVAVYSGATDCSEPTSCLANIINPSNWSTDNGPGFQCCDATGVEYPDDVPSEFEGLFCQPPVITCPADVITNCDESTDPVTTGNPTFTEGCGVVTITFTDTETIGACANEKVISRTWNAIDEDGNSTICTQTITVIDETPPTAPPPPADVAVQCATDIPPPVDLTAADNCSEDITVSPTEQIISGSCTNDFTLIRTWTFDDGCGNTSSVSQTITIQDNTVPVAPLPPADLTLQCADDVPLPVDLTATDNCDGTITVSPTETLIPGECVNDFTMIRTWTFTDVCGNASSVSQKITVEDNTAPVAPVPPADLTLQCADDVPPPIDLTATDNCDGDITVSPTAQIIPGVCANDFVMVRTWTFADVCGNTSSVSQTITIEDNEAPVAPAPPADVTVQCADDLPAPIDLTATDNCEGSITVSPTAVITPGTSLNDFILVRTWTFVDLCGNSSSVSQTITVYDNTPPVAICDNITINLDASGNASITTSDIDGGSYDNCTAGSDLILTAFPTNFTAADIGVNLVILTVVDENGNSSSCTAEVIVDRRLTTITYNGDLSGQYSDQINLSAKLIDDFTGLGLPGKTLTFTLGTQSTMAITDVTGTASSTLILNQPPSVLGYWYDVVVEFTGDAIYKESDSSDPFDLQKEDARATYTGVMYVSTSSSKSSTAIVTLSATIQDITAIPGSDKYDMFGGDIRNADVTFIDVDNGNTPISPPLPVKLINPGNKLVGNVVYEWIADIGNADSETFTIGISVNNYYDRYDPSENSLITISKPLDDFVTGGGFILLENSGGIYAGDLGSKTNFGLNVKFNKKGTNLQGKVLILVRRTEPDGVHTYRIKSNKLNSMAINNGSADVTGKANIEDVTDPYFPISVAGNQIFELELQDNGEPGVSDLIGFTLYGDGGGLFFSSYWTGITTIPQTLDGGNIAVHNRSNSIGRIDNSDEISNELDEIVNSVQLSSYPNPFHNEAIIEFIIPYDSEVTVDIYTLTGIRLKTLFHENVLANKTYRVVFEREFFSDNIFIYKLNTDFGSHYGKLISR